MILRINVIASIRRKPNHRRARRWVAAAAEWLRAVLVVKARALSTFAPWPRPIWVIAVAAYRLALEERTRKQVPLEWARTHNNLGIVLQKQNHLAEAIEHFQLALRLRPRYPEARYNLGAAFEEAGRLQ